MAFFDMDQVLPKLYLGNIVNSKHQRHLEKFNIKKIVSVYEFARERFSDCTYLSIRLKDRDTEDLSQYFMESNVFIHSARLSSEGVLVHCIKGASRSATLVLVYLMSVTDLNLQDALIYLRKKRPIVKPNRGFMRQLEEFEKNGLAAERERLKQLFPNDAELRLTDQTEISIVDMPKCAQL